MYDPTVARLTYRALLGRRRAAILFVLAGATSAHACQYTLTYDFAGDLSEATGSLIES